MCIHVYTHIHALTHKYLHTYVHVASGAWFYNQYSEAYGMIAYFMNICHDGVHMIDIVLV